MNVKTKDLYCECISITQPASMYRKVYRVTGKIFDYSLDEIAQICGCESECYDAYKTTKYVELIVLTDSITAEELAQFSYLKKGV